MKKALKCIFVLIFSSLIYNCDDLSKNSIIGKYYLVSVDSIDDTSLSYSINNDDSSFANVVGETVFAVGHNDDFIIVKQHPRVFGNEPDKTTTNYFIVKIYKKNTLWAEKGVIGPLTKKEFEQKRKDLKIENIKFDFLVDDLE